jgi:hypothetical protein
MMEGTDDDVPSGRQSFDQQSAQCESFRGGNDSYGAVVFGGLSFSFPLMKGTYRGGLGVGIH